MHVAIIPRARVHRYGTLLGAVTPRTQNATIAWVTILVIGLLAIGWCSRSPAPRPTAPAPQSEAPGSTTPSPPDARAAAPASPLRGGQWIEDPLETENIYEKGISFRLDAEALPPGRTASRRPYLVVRCQNTRTDVILTTWTPTVVDRRSPGRAVVGLSFDDAPASRERWRESSDREALFAPDALRLARAIAKAQTLRVEFTPVNAPVVTVAFNVAGFDQHIATLAADCGWKP